MSRTEMLLNVQISMGLLWWALVARWYGLPWLYKQPFQAALVPPLLIAVLRFHGLNFLVPDINNGLAAGFAEPAAIGDFLVCLLALAAAFANRAGASVGPLLAWAYAILGSADFMMGFYLGDVNGMPLHLGATWFMVSQEAPLELMALFVLFRVLLKHPNKAAA